MTIGGTVSPAGGDFEEPVTQSTLKVVGAFHGLSRQRSDARRYPAIDPLESWSKYASIVPERELTLARRVLAKGHEVQEMMKVVEEEGTAMADFVVYLKAEYLDAVYLQQDAFDPVDGATSAERQRHVFALVGAHPRRRDGLRRQGRGTRVLPDAHADDAGLEPRGDGGRGLRRRRGSRRGRCSPR